jgi:hypothetical protein
MDWSILKKVCMVGMLVAITISLRPWSTCTFIRMNSAQLSSIAEGGTPGEADVSRVDEAGEFTGGFFGSLPVCYRAYPIGRASWQWPTILGLLGGFLLFRQLQHHEYVSRVRKASGAHIGLAEARRQKLEKDAGATKERPGREPAAKKSLEDDRADW